MNLQDLSALLTANPYPGRGIVLGRSANGAQSIAAYFIMGRSENSRNRIFVETEDGKKKKILDEYIYDQGICMYCQVCVRVCPQDAITFDQSYETAVFDRQKLVRQLNQPGSKCQERKPVARPAAAPKPAEKPAAATASAPVEAADAAEKTPKTE